MVNGQFSAVSKFLLLGGHPQVSTVCMKHCLSKRHMVYLLTKVLSCDDISMISLSSVLVFPSPQEKWSDPSESAQQSRRKAPALGKMDMRQWLLTSSNVSSFNW